MLERLLEAIAAVSETPVKTRVKTPVKTDAQLLALLRRQPTLTLADAAAHLGKSVSAVERLVRKLREAGRLRHVGPQKGGHWEVLS
ncbi:MAG: winged helix-turn-helix domain-containing protein [Rhodanobacteraceae bacterium]|nr:winged helix-turn-helix domain-containing protein [Rhodanobacteraceae bacterium]